MEASLGKRIWVHRWFLALLALAVALHLPIYGDGLNFDAGVAMETAETIAQHGSLQLETTLAPHHPPGMALVYLPFGLALGFSESSNHTMQLVFLVIDLCFVYFLARDLGPKFSLVAPLLLAVDPILYLNMSEGRSLSAMILFTLLTLWGIWKGLDNSRWLAVAAVGASLGFLTADAVGPLFVAAGAAGFLWRFYYLRWNLLRNRGYLAAIAIFGSVAVGWTAYNWAAFGTPITDPRTALYLGHFFAETPLHVAVITIGGLAVFFALYVVQAALPFLTLREGRQALAALPRRALRDQKVGAMVVFIGVVISLSAFVAGVFTLYEPDRPLRTADTYLRYVAMVSPITYLAIGMHGRSTAGAKRPLRFLLPFAATVLLLTAQLVPRISQGDRNGSFFEALDQQLHSRGYSTIYTEGAIALRYNLPHYTFVTVDKGYSTPTVNITTNDVPLGAAMVTSLYVPKAYDAKVGNLYLIDHFDPKVQNPFVNNYYVH